MKRLFAVAVLAAASSPTFAADLGLGPQQPPYPPPISFNWSSCYLGPQGGWTGGQSQHVAAASPFGGEVGLPITNSFNVNGAIFGVTLGCNYQLTNFAFGQLNNFVFGTEGDAAWSTATGSANNQPPFGRETTSTTNETSFSTLRGRLGYAWDRFLFYGTGGVAFADVGVQVCGPVNCALDAQARTGWVAGAGVEWATWTFPDGSWRIKLEYLHDDFGNNVLISPPVPEPNGSVFVSRNVRLTNNLIRVGINWSFICW
jgi:outer membrane immunogenic protein